MNDADCVHFLQWALPRLRMRWAGFRRVRRQVCKRVQQRLRVLGLDDVSAYRDYLNRFPGEWAVLDGLTHITISRFYRDAGVFQALQERVLPALVQQALAQGRDTLQVWSAGAGAGEEPYTVAILWALVLQIRWPGVRLHIVATEADPGQCARARRACYGESSLRALPRSWRQRAFRRRGGEYCLDEPFRRGVELHCQDIRRAMPRGPFDLVLWRNLVFTYFDDTLQRELLRRLARRMYAGGALVIGAHEELPPGAAGFVPWPQARCVHRFVPGTGDV